MEVRDLSDGGTVIKKGTAELYVTPSRTAVRIGGPFNYVYSMHVDEIDDHILALEEARKVSGVCDESSCDIQS